MEKMMRSYRVTLARIVHEEAEVDVDAADEIEAEDVAINATWHAEWKWVDDTDPEVIYVEEVEP